MLSKFLLITAVVLFSSQIVNAKGLFSKWFKPEEKREIVKPVLTGLIKQGLKMLLPKHYNVDIELDKYIGFAGNMGAIVNELFINGIVLLNSAKTDNRPRKGRLDPKGYDAIIDLGKNSVNFLRNLAVLLQEMHHTFIRQFGNTSYLASLYPLEEYKQYTPNFEEGDSN